MRRFPALCGPSGQEDTEAGESIEAEEEAAGATVVGAQELFKANGIPFKALFVASEFLSR